MALALIGIVAALICSVAMLMLGAAWWLVLLGYMGTGMAVMLGGAVWIYRRTPMPPRQGLHSDERPGPSAALPAARIRNVPGG